MSDPCLLHVSSKKRCQWRLFTYHLKAHAISNKLVSKVSTQKKGGGEVMTATNMCSNFGGFRCSQVVFVVLEVDSWPLVGY